MVRSPAGLVVVVVLHACAGAPTSAPASVPADAPVAPLERDRVVAPAPAVEPVGVAEPRPEPPAAPPSEQARLMAEVEAMDATARWAWAVVALPELLKHSGVDPAPGVWAELRRRAAGRGTLWVRTRTDRCFVVRGEWTEQGFFGRAHASTGVAGGVKTVHYEQVAIDAYTITRTGPNGDLFNRAEDGRWMASGAFGMGGMTVLADRAMSRSRGGAAYYGREAYALDVECTQRASYEQRCTDGTTRTCERCGGLTAQVQSPPHHAVRVNIGAGSEAPLQDCSQACPVDAALEKLPALARVVSERQFFASGPPVAAVYTSQKACRADGVFARKGAGST